MPPAFWAWATTCSARVVLPELSGPKISMTRPRGSPPTPTAASRPMLEVEITGTSSDLWSPRRMIAPLPNCFSMLSRAASTAFAFSLFSIAIGFYSFCLLSRTTGRKRRLMVSPCERTAANQSGSDTDPPVATHLGRIVTPHLKAHLYFQKRLGAYDD